MAVKKPDIQAIFHEALAKDSDQQRSEYLHEVCADNPQVKNRVQALLRAYSEAGGFFGGEETRAEDSLSTETAGTTIGPYKIRERLAEGGMGVVYVAEQTEPVCRKVALKIIRPGMATTEVIARFEAERQALAMMDHPNIARVFDGGATESGQPYFVMELVQGVPITEYCDQHALSNRDRLALCRDVCRAVQHAHQKGIIHRDIKPSNVLVAEIDGQAVPKVIDFGVAKAISQKLVEQSVYTQFSQVIGTPLYMSPEQAGVGVVDIDTRSDVYSLGVLLYELVTGQTPFDKNKFKKIDFEEMRRIIREDDPPLPSARVSTLRAEQISTVAERHGEDERKYPLSLRGELDWLVMRAMEKDRSRRYQSAGELADDLQRYLHHEPVEACPPSPLYRLRKFTHRHKPALVTAAVVFLALLGGTCVAAWQAVRATRAEQQATDRLAEVDHQRGIADQNAQEAEAFADFLVNDLLASAAPEETLGKNVTVEEVLANAEERIDDAFEGQPRVEAAVRHTMGNVYRKLGQYETAERNLDRALSLRRRVLGPEHPDTLDAMNALGVVYERQGNYEAAQKRHEATLKLRRRVLGPEHPDTLASAMNLANVYKNQGNFGPARERYEETLEVSRRVLGPEHVQTIKVMGNLAAVHWRQHDLAAARELGEETLKLFRRVRGENHPDTLGAMHSLATFYAAADKHDAACELFEETVKRKRRVFGPEHPSTLNSMNSLANTHKDLGSLSVACDIYQETLKICRRALGTEHKVTMYCLANLAVVRSRQGKLDAAQQLYEEALDMSLRNLGSEHPSTLTVMCNVAILHKRKGELEEANNLYEKIVMARHRVLGPEHYATLTALNGFLGSSEAINKHAEAKRVWNETWGGDERKAVQERPPESPTVEYRIQISDPGEYQLYVRWDGHNYRSDSIYVGLLENENNLSWYLFEGGSPELGGTDADFATYSWETFGHRGHLGSENLKQPQQAALWSISEPGEYTLRIWRSEEGAAVDALVLQQADLPSPQDDGPPESERSESGRFLESQGRIVIEAEHFTSRKPTGPEEAHWRVGPEDTDGHVSFENFRGSGYIQALPRPVWPSAEKLLTELRSPEQAVDLFATNLRGSPTLDLTDEETAAIEPVAGKFERDGEEIHVQSHSKLKFRLGGSTSYLLRARWTRMSGDGDVGFLLPLGEQTVSLTLSGWGGTKDALWWINDNEFARPSSFENEKPHLLEAIVDSEGEQVSIYIFLDGQGWLYWEGKRPKCEVGGNNGLPEAGVLGMYTHDSDLVVHSMAATAVREPVGATTEKPTATQDQSAEPPSE